jgi:ACS family tartrate transporter-like MFS transporter
VTEAERVFAKAARRLIPLLCLLYVANFLDRVNVGLAAQTMNRDLGLSPQVYGFGAGIFFAGYVLCEVPSNLVFARVGARRWIFRIMLSWGVLSAATAFARGPVSFSILRFFLGVCEAGFFPGVMLYLTYWFPQSSRARFNALYLSVLPFSNVIGAPLSVPILSLEGTAGLHGWQWLFLLEGIPSCLLAFAALFFLPDGPRDAAWLTPAEKQTVTAALADGTPREGSLWSALGDWRVWTLTLADFGIVLGTYGLVLWLPQIVAQMGYGHLATGFIVAVPYAFALAAMLAWARSSDVRNERPWHIAIAAVTGCCGLLIAAAFPQDIIRMIGLTLASMGIYAALVTFWTLPQSFLGGTAAATGIALVNAVGNIGGFAGPFLMGRLKETSGGYGEGFCVLAAGLALTAVAAFVAARAIEGRDAAAENPSSAG